MICHPPPSGAAARGTLSRERDLGPEEEAEGAEAVGRRTYLSSKRRLGRLGSDIRGRAIDKKGTTPEAQGIRHAKLFDDNAAVGLAWSSAATRRRLSSSRLAGGIGSIPDARRARGDA